MMRKIYADTEPWIYRLMLVSFFLPHKLQTIIFIFFAAWVVINAVQQKISLTRNECFIALLLGGGYLFYVAYLPLTMPAQQHLVYSLLERKISLFIFPFIIPVAIKLSQTSFRAQLKYFAFANILHGLCINLYILFSYLQTHVDGFGHVAYRSAFDSASGIHPTYYGMFICFSLTILLASLVRRGEFRHAALSLIMQCLLLLFLLMLSPKISLLIAALIYAWYFFFELKWKLLHKMILFASSLAVLTLLFFLIPFFHQRIGEVLSFMTGQPGSAVENSMIFRRMILDIDLRILHDSWLLGIGPARLQQNLDMAYALIWNITGVPVKSYNTHNEYLNQWICFGLGGLLFFVMIFVIHLRQAYRRVDKMYLITALIIMITCLTENVLSRQPGILFMALLLPLFYFEENTKKAAI